MKKKQLIDFLIILLVYISFSCIPFGLFIKSENLSWLILMLQIGVQVGILVFILLFTRFKTQLDYSHGKFHIVNTLLLIPTLIICFSNLFNLKITSGSTSIIVTLDLFLCIFITVVTVINEEIIFRLLLINNLEIKNNLLIILISAGVFGVCHITHFLTTFNPTDLLIVVYTFLLGLLLGFAYLFAESIFPCIIIHFLFNLFNDILFPCFALEWVYILITSAFVVITFIYVTILYIYRMKPKISDEKMNI